MDNGNNGYGQKRRDSHEPSDLDGGCRNLRYEHEDSGAGLSEPPCGDSRGIV